MKQRIWLSFIFLALQVTPILGYETKSPEALPKPKLLESYWDYVPANAVALMNIDVSSIVDKLNLGLLLNLLPNESKEFESTYGIQLERIQKLVLIALPGDRHNIAYLIHTTATIPDPTTQQCRLKQATKTQIGNRNIYINKSETIAYVQIDALTYLIANSQADLENCLNASKQNRDPAVDAAIVRCNQKDIFGWVRMARSPYLIGQLAEMHVAFEEATLSYHIERNAKFICHVYCKDESKTDMIMGHLESMVDGIRGMTLIGSAMAFESTLYFQEYQLEISKKVPRKFLREFEQTLRQSKIEKRENVVSLTLQLSIDPQLIQSGVDYLAQLIEILPKSATPIERVEAEEINTRGPGSPEDAKSVAYPEERIALPDPDQGRIRPTSIPICDQVPLKNIATPATPLPQQPSGLPLPQLGTDAAWNPVQPTTYSPPASPVPSYPATMPVAPSVVPYSIPIVPTNSTMPLFPIATLPPPATPIFPNPPISFTPPSPPVTPTVPPSPMAPQLPVENRIPRQNLPSIPTIREDSPQAILVSVANVRKETAILFLQKSDGSLEFLNKIPAGEAVDLPGNVGHKWIAIFPNQTAALTKQIQSSEKIWLLR